MFLFCCNIGAPLTISSNSFICGYCAFNEYESSFTAFKACKCIRAAKMAGAIHKSECNSER